MLVSVIIRTLNEEEHLPELLGALESQVSDRFVLETVIVDSGSTDRTLDIANEFDCRISTISKSEFSFGRSLNVGCKRAKGEILIFISGHCIPVSQSWMHNLCLPLEQELASYSYGRQIGRDTTKFSEHQVLEKYFPIESNIPQLDNFCNNANAALLKSAWNDYKFDEDLTGLEDMHLAKTLREAGLSVGYVGAQATVYHIHDESWEQTLNRYEREALALQQINPNIQISFSDFIHFYVSSVAIDVRLALAKQVLLQELKGILSFRAAQYWGSYRGNKLKRKLNNTETKKYYYPKNRS